MQYIVFSDVDFKTKIPAYEDPCVTAPVPPEVPGLEVKFVLRSQFPTQAPVYYGTCSDEYDHESAPIPGVMNVISEEDFVLAKKMEFDAMRELYLDQMNFIRETYLSRGFIYQFSDGPGTVQTRDMRDIMNVHMNASTAMAFIVQGQGGTILSFRDTENVIHKIPATELLDMSMKAIQYGYEVYSTSWRHKDVLKGEHPVIKVSSLEDLYEYSIYEGWPDQYDELDLLTDSES